MLLPAGAAALCLLSPFSGTARAQTADLPAAPSAVLAKQIQQEQEEAHSRVAGSNFKFTAPKTIPGPGGEAIELPTDTPLPISLDDAIALGLERNVRLRYDRAKQKMVHGEELGVINALLPGLRATASTSTQEINLAAMGFKPQSLGPVLSQFGIAPSAFKTIVKVNVTQAVVSANQELFDLPAYELYRGARREAQVVDLDVLNSRGDLVYSVGAAYLRVLADQSSLINAQAQERASRMLFDQATERKNAGIGINLDVLRGQVAYQQHQQARIAAEAQLAKDTIQLNRIMGLPAGQKLELTDTAPFTDLVG
ncbi:MAG TPA: TolC family protein, partial [Acidobacteriaceae bacterium]|nr:TolC family protein [Acidobacteriaceae bacterium]